MRQVTLDEPDVISFANKIAFTPGAANKAANGKTIFEYVVAADYADTLVDLDATDPQTNYNLRISRAEGPLDLNQMVKSRYNETDFLWFQIDISEQ